MALLTLGAPVVGRPDSEPTVHLVGLADQEEAQSNGNHHDDPTPEKAAEEIGEGRCHGKRECGVRLPRS